MPDWKHINGSLARIAVGSRTNVWGVNAAGAIYR
ncbi:tectonin domain-containing protein [Streptomyces sp. NPDC001621]